MYFQSFIYLKFYSYKALSRPTLFLNRQNTDTQKAKSVQSEQHEQFSVAPSVTSV